MALDRTELLQYLSERFAVSVDGLGDEEPLFSSGLLDSFNVTELVLYIEERSGRFVDPDDLSFENLDSVARILRFASALSERGR